LISTSEIKARHAFIKAAQFAVLANEYLVGVHSISAIKALSISRYDGRKAYD